MNKIRIKRLVAAIVATTTMGFATGSASAGGLLSVDFNAGNFGASQNVNNQYWPLAPGVTATTFIYLGETEDGCVFDKVESNPGLVKVFEVAPYDQVVPLVVVDTEWEVEMECDEIRDELFSNPPASYSWEPDEGIGELTHDWYAQDGFKNIWYMGEASRDFGTVEIDGIETECPSTDDVPLWTARDDWPEIVPDSDDLFLECTGGSWEAGQPGQEEGEINGIPGIVVPSDTPFGDGNPLTPGTYWMQEVAENAQDMAKVLRTIAPLDDDEQCRKVKEWNPFEHGGSVEHKWYCKDGDGLVLIEGIGGGPTEIEELVLVYNP